MAKPGRLRKCAWQCPGRGDLRSAGEYHILIKIGEAEAPGVYRRECDMRAGIERCVIFIPINARVGNHEMRGREPDESELRPYTWRGTPQFVMLRPVNRGGTGKCRASIASSNRRPTSQSLQSESGAIIIIVTAREINRPPAANPTKMARIYRYRRPIREAAVNCISAYRSVAPKYALPCNACIKLICICYFSCAASACLYQAGGRPMGRRILSSGNRELSSLASGGEARKHHAWQP